MENIENETINESQTLLTTKEPKQAIWFKDKELKLEFKRLRKEAKMKPESFLRELLTIYKNVKEEEENQNDSLLL